MGTKRAVNHVSGEMHTVCQCVVEMATCNKVTVTQGTYDTLKWRRQNSIMFYLYPLVSTFLKLIVLAEQRNSKETAEEKSYFDSQLSRF